MVVKKKVSLGVATPQASQTASAPSLEVLELFFNTGIVFHEVPCDGDLPDVVSSFCIMKEPGASGAGADAQSGKPPPAASAGKKIGLPKSVVPTPPPIPTPLGSRPSIPSSPSNPGPAPSSLKDGFRVRRAEPGEEPDVEISCADHLAELSGRWLPIPYQLSNPHAVQVYLAPEGPRSARILLAVDTLERTGSQGRHLDAALDRDRPFRPLDKADVGPFFDHSETRDLVRRLEKAGIDRALFKLAALFDTLYPLLPKIKLSRLEEHPQIPVSLVLDFGNSRSSALIVEPRSSGMSAVPLTVRNYQNPFDVSEETFDSRVTFVPSPFDKSHQAVATNASFDLPSIVRMGREALDRAVETPHRYACTLSGPKRYLWDHRPSDERWHFAKKVEGENPPIFGRLLKYLPEESGGLFLREDGPMAPPNPRYAPRTMMLFAMVEILTHAFSQIASPTYRAFQGKEGNPRVLKNLVVTFPSGMPDEERRVYDTLIRNAVILTAYVLNLPPEARPNFDPQTNQYSSFLFVDEALAAQMVYLYEEVAHTFKNSMEELIAVYGGKAADPELDDASRGGADAAGNGGARATRPSSPSNPSLSGGRTSGVHVRGSSLRIASVDIGGGTTDVMIAEYEDRLPGTGTALKVRKLFQDGVSIAGDEVCRALVEDIVFAQILAQIPTASARRKLVHLMSDGDAGFGAEWKSLRARLVPNYWMPLARCFWALGEGAVPGEIAPGQMVLPNDALAAFGRPPLGGAVLDEADDFLTKHVPDFPGLFNVFLTFDHTEVARVISRVLREPLRRYADILAQFDIDLLVLAGRASALTPVRELFVNELAVPPPRIKAMGNFRVSEWYPSKWQEAGLIKDPKSTVAAGAAILHLASKNALAGFALDEIIEAEKNPVYGLYQDTEPHIPHDNELFPRESERQNGRSPDRSRQFHYTSEMRIGFRNVASEQVEGSPLFEIRPATREVEQALLDDRVTIEFQRTKDAPVIIAKVESTRGQYSYEPTDFVMALKTATFDKYWLDSGVFLTKERLP